MAVAGNWITAAGRLNQDVRPNKAGFNVDGSHLRDADAFFVSGEKRAFAARHRFIAHFDVSWKKQVAFGPAAGFESLNCHRPSEHHPKLQRNSLRLHLFVKIRPRKIKLVNHAFVANNVNFPTLISAESSDALGRSANLAHGLQSAVVLLEAEDAMRSVIAANVN